MMTAKRMCAKCGAKIFAEAPQEFCSACLLETGLGLCDDNSVAGVVEPGRHDGLPAMESKKAGRLAGTLGDFGDYELLEEIGRGGQGVVYRAQQKSLNRTVALKVIGLGPWATEAHVKRFRREAEAAASLDNPGIVPIYEVGERDGSCYFSMKFVEGGQLDEVVRQPPMSIRQAAELIAKVARTVHYAHEHGILHRDIKPGNILLDQKGEPHLTDFGLARLVEIESTVTRTKEALGTPSYMAPEQAVGETKTLTSATDVYGLGAVLYQSLTGQPPFAGGTTYATIRLLLDTEPRSPRSLNPKVDRDLSTICLKCLEKDPKRRYSSALALAEDLEHWLKHEPIRAKRSGVFTHSRKWVRRNPSTTVLLTLLLALAVGLSVMIWSRKPRVIIPKSIAVLPFENLSPDPDNAYLADGMQEEILTRLARISDLKVISRTSTSRYKSKPDNLADIAKQLGVANILEGSVQTAGGQMRLNVQLINAETDAHLWAETYDRKLTDVFDVESEIAKGITESLQVKLTGHEQQALAVRPTNNPEAYEAYLRGLSLQGRGNLSTDVDNIAQEGAVHSFERAVQLDPKFAIAWARLSRLQGEIDDDNSTESATTKRALENAQKLAPSSSETLLALGYYQLRVLRDYGVAKTTFTHVGKMSPNNSEVQWALGRVAWRQEQCDESIAYKEQALALDPRNVELLMNAAIMYANLRQFPNALKLYDRVLDITPNDLDVMAQKAVIYQAQGNLEEAAKLLAEINPEIPSCNTFGRKIRQLWFGRNLSDAVGLLQARLGSSEHANSTERLRLALTQRFAGDAVGAKVTAQLARNRLEQLCKDEPKASQLAVELSQAYAVMGEKDLAIREAERAIMVERPFGAILARAPQENLAIILTMVGENSRAISILAELLQKPYWSLRYGPPPITPALLKLDPTWDPLRGDPRFQKLCEEKKP
jgi:serine/threonine protein kinase/tetratricopeptide (TPR) repeat protein